MEVGKRTERAFWRGGRARREQELRVNIPAGQITAVLSYEAGISVEE